MLRLLALLPVLTACYIYAPIDPAAVKPGASVRARVSAATAEELRPLLGTPQRVLNGTVIADGDPLILEVPSVMRAEIGSSIQTLNQRVSIPRTGLLEMETRTLDRFRTYALAGVATAVVGGYILRRTVFGPGSGNTGGGGGPEFRLPIFSGRR